MDMKNIKAECALSDPENWPCQWALPPDQNHKIHRCPRTCDHFTKREPKGCIRYPELRLLMECKPTKLPHCAGCERTKKLVGGFENCLLYDGPCKHKLKKGEMHLCPSPCEHYESKDRNLIDIQGKATAIATVKADIQQEAFGLTHKKIEQMLGLNQAVQDMTVTRLHEIKKEIETAILLQLKVLEKLNVRVEGIIILRPDLEEGQKSRDGFANLQEITIHLGLS